jgi:hypothetical protein
MTSFEHERLQRYNEDAGQWLATIQMILQYPATPQQAAALSMCRAASELVIVIKQQIEIDQ